MDGPSIFFIFALAIVVIPLFWCGVVWLLSWVSGWARLAKTFAAADRPPTGRKSAFLYGSVGVVGYNGVLILHEAEDGVFLEVMTLFRIGHPRLFIPWSAISKRKTIDQLFRKAVRLRVGSPIIATITVPERALSRHAG